MDPDSLAADQWAPAGTSDSVLPSRTYKVDLRAGRALGQVDGLEAMRQYVQKALLTPRFSAPYLTSQYGCDLDALVGKPVDYVRADLTRVLQEACAEDDRVTAVSVDTIEQPSPTVLTATVTVSTIYGDVTTTTEVAAS